MTPIPNELIYSKSHEWLRHESDDIYVLGITDFAQSQLGDIVFVELPDVGKTIDAGDEIIVVESVKTAADVYAPVSGEVISINEQLAENPALINTDPYNQAWLIRIRINNSSELEHLMDAKAYETSINES